MNEKVAALGPQQVVLSACATSGLPIRAGLIQPASPSLWMTASMPSQLRTKPGSPNGAVRSLRLAEEMGQRYDVGMTHLEAGQRSGDRTHLGRAEGIFAEIGAVWDLARAREALSKTQNP
jgi:hypothetical protein